MSSALEELREAMDDPRMAVEFYVLGGALLEIARKLDELQASLVAGKRKEEPSGDDAIA